jgi:hypothetical protein
MSLPTFVSRRSITETFVRHRFFASSSSLLFFCLNRLLIAHSQKLTLTWRRLVQLRGSVGSRTELPTTVTIASDQHQSTISPKRVHTRLVSFEYLYFVEVDSSGMRSVLE